MKKINQSIKHRLNVYASIKSFWIKSILFTTYLLTYLQLNIMFHSQQNHIMEVKCGKCRCMLCLSYSSRFQLCRLHTVIIKVPPRDVMFVNLKCDLSIKRRPMQITSSKDSWYNPLITEDSRAHANSDTPNEYICFKWIIISQRPGRRASYSDSDSTVKQTGFLLSKAALSI